MGETTPDLPRNEREPNILLSLLRKALDTKDKSLLKNVVDTIKRQVDGNRKDNPTNATPVTDKQLEELLQTGQGEIYVGSGTNGQRIFIDKGKMFMPTGSERSQQLGVYHQENFRSFFDIPEGEYLEVSF